MGHQMIGHHLVTVFAFTTSSVTLQLLSLNRFVRLIIMDCYGFDVHLRVVPHQNESTGVDVPPVPALVLDEIADQLRECYLQVGLHKFGYVFDVGQSLPQVLFTGAFDSVESLGHFGVDYEFANLVNFLSRGILVIGTQHPTFVITILSPTCTHH